MTQYLALISRLIGLHRNIDWHINIQNKKRKYKLWMSKEIIRRDSPEPSWLA